MMAGTPFPIGRNDAAPAGAGNPAPHPAPATTPFTCRFRPPAGRCTTANQKTRKDGFFHETPPNGQKTAAAPVAVGGEAGNSDD